MDEQVKTVLTSPRRAKQGVWVTVGYGVDHVSHTPQAIRAGLREATAHGWTEDEARRRAHEAWEREKRRAAQPAGEAILFCVEAIPGGSGWLNEMQSLARDAGIETLIIWPAITDAEGEPR